MANEATKFIETGLSIPMTIHPDLAIEKGALLNLSDPFTVSGNAVGGAEAVAGIAKAEAISGDGVDQIPVFREGIFKVTASGSIGIGQAVCWAAAANKVAVCGGPKNIFHAGVALEAATDGQTFLMELKPVTKTPEAT